MNQEPEDNMTADELAITTTGRNAHLRMCRWMVSPGGASKVCGHQLQDRPDRKTFSCGCFDGGGYLREKWEGI